MHEYFLHFLAVNDLSQPICFPTQVLGNTFDPVMSNIDISDPAGEPSCPDHHVINFTLCSDVPVKHINQTTTPTLTGSLLQPTSQR